METQGLIASLESKIDHLETELSYVNALLIDYGFDDGINTLKRALIEIKEEEKTRL